MIEIIVSTGNWLTDHARVASTRLIENARGGDNCDKTHPAHPYNLAVIVNGHTDIRI